MVRVQGIKTKQVMKYALLPGIIPRTRSLFASGFGYIAFLMATIYNTVRLLPTNHPYLQSENIGKFGIRHVVAAAANNLVIKKENIDQLVVFVALLAGLVILCLQFVLLIYAFIFQPAFALSIFDTPQPENDIAFLLLDNVFGIPGYSCNAAGLCSAVAATLGTNGLPFHQALHSMFQFYSVGLLLIGMLIFLYFVVVVVAETATSGTPFGQRFQNIWVPIRLVVALGLLVPINHGLNSGQYITLFAAKYGSSFATNGWLRFNRTIGTVAPNPTGEAETLLAKPVTPDVSPIIGSMSLVHSCAYAHWKVEGHWKSNGAEGPAILNDATRPPSDGAHIKPYLVKYVFPWMDDKNAVEAVEDDTSYENALAFYGNSDIIIRFGREANVITDTADLSKIKEYRGEIEPTCGEIRVPITDAAHIGDGDDKGGANAVQKFYYKLILDLWFASKESLMITVAHRRTEKAMAAPPLVSCNIGCNNGSLPACNVSSDGPPDCEKDPPNVKARQEIVNHYQPLLEGAVTTAWENFNANSTDMEMSEEILERGWGGAGIWYNKISEMNGAFVTAVMNMPAPSLMPKLMDEVVQEKMKVDRSIDPDNKYQPNYADNRKSMWVSNKQTLAEAMNDHYVYWNKEGTNLSYQDKTVTTNAFETIMNILFGTSGLFDMRQENNFTHPLAQLSAVGKGLVDSAIRNTMGASVFAFMGGAAAASGGWDGLGKLGEVFGSFLFSTAFVGLTAGLVLFYVLPFLPFVYFYFAVGSWVKSIFEAMVGVPLWALAHLRIDGEGLPGESATNGYFLIFEIFIRPILTVFALVAAMVIFTAQVRVLNFIWGLVVDNLTGHEINTNANVDVETTLFKFSVQRGIIDQFFFTIIYTIIVYMLATASFKLIDKIPDNILRWMGAGVSSFSDINQDPVEGLTKYAALGGLTVGQQTTKGLTDAAKGLGKTTGGSLGQFSNIINQK